MPKEPKETKKPTARKATTRKVTAAVRKPRAKKTAVAAATPQDVEVRAYFLHLEQPWADPAENWLRAERELAPA